MKQELFAVIVATSLVASCAFFCACTVTAYKAARFGIHRLPGVFLIGLLCWVSSVFMVRVSLEAFLFLAFGVRL